MAPNIYLKKKEIKDNYLMFILYIINLFLQLIDTLLRHEIFPEFRNFTDLRGHSRGNPRSGVIFMGGGGVVGTINCVYFETITIYRY